MEECVQEKDERKIVGGSGELRPFKPQTLQNSRVSENTPEMLGQPLLDLVPSEFEFSEGMGVVCVCLGVIFEARSCLEIQTGLQNLPVDQASLEVTTVLLQPPENWDFRCEPG